MFLTRCIFISAMIFERLAAGLVVWVLFSLVIRLFLKQVFCRVNKPQKHIKTTIIVTRCSQPVRAHCGNPHARRQLAKRLNGACVPPRHQAFAHINEHEDKVELSLDVPGIKASDLTVNVENRVLTITGIRTVSRCNRSSKWQLSRQFALDTSVDTDNLSANLADGVLTILAPKIEKPGAVKIIITEEPTTTAVQETTPSVTAESAAEEPEVKVAAEDPPEEDDLVMVETANEDEAMEDDDEKLKEP